MPNLVICQYRVKAGAESAFEELLAAHWPTLHRLGLVTDEPSQQFRGTEQRSAEPLYVEIFEWLDGAVDRAHEHPDVMRIWEPMDTLCEARGDKLNMEFPHFERI